MPVQRLMTILERVRLFLRSKHVHAWRWERHRLVCACGVVRTSPSVAADYDTPEHLEERLAALDFHAGERY